MLNKKAHQSFAQKQSLTRNQFFKKNLKFSVLSFGLLFSHCVWAASTIQSPENIVVLSINQQAVKGGLLHNKKQYQLESGPAELTLRYQQYFDHGNSQHDILKSDEIVLQIPNLNEGQKYRLALEHAPKDFEAARDYVDHPVIALYDQNNQAVELKQRNTQKSAPLFGSLFNKEQSTVYSNSVAEAQINATVAKSEQSQNTVFKRDAQQLNDVQNPEKLNDSLPKDQEMIRLWQQASKAERQKFMSWLADH